MSNPILSKAKIAPAAMPAWRPASAGLSGRARLYVTRLPAGPALAPADQTLAPSERTAACPASPRRCPFGGACHTCPTGLQARLRVSRPGDADEQEAARVADAVMGSGLKRTSGWGERTEPGSGGAPLPEEMRAFFEPRFGHDFSRVRVHTGAEAAKSARSVNALAYTLGRDIVFAAGQYAPETDAGRNLIAHELAHVIQQQGVPPSVQRDEDPTGDAEGAVEPKLDQPGADADALQAGAGGACAEKATWKPDAAIPVDIQADSVVAFVTEANATLGSPHMSWDWGTEPAPAYDSQGKATKINLWVKTSIQAPRLGLSRAPADEKQIIDDIVKRIREHEQTHRSDLVNVMDAAVCAALGKTESGVKAVLQTAICTTAPQKFSALDATEGQIELDKNAAGTKVIGFHTAGVKVNYKDPGCKV
ncbi:MAG: DUF4157 domain-containing protein [Chloroflexi bacterium]|nr:DUF4157 domain-containing protein [Chloroflexota bacterium]